MHYILKIPAFQMLEQELSGIFECNKKSRY